MGLNPGGGQRMMSNAASARSPHPGSAGSALCKVFGVFEVTITEGSSAITKRLSKRTMRYILMEQLFDVKKMAPSFIFDLKGSQRNRFADRTSAVSMDENLLKQILENRDLFYCSDLAYRTLMHRFDAASDVLAASDVMDYSMLVAGYFPSAAKRAQAMSNATFGSPSAGSGTQMEGGNSIDSANMSGSMANSSNLSSIANATLGATMVQQLAGSFAQSASAGGSPTAASGSPTASMAGVVERPVLVVGIIDYLRKFSVDKYLENLGKRAVELIRLRNSKRDPTIVPPGPYRDRFLSCARGYFCPVMERLDVVRRHLQHHDAATATQRQRQQQGFASLSGHRRVASLQANPMSPSGQTGGTVPTSKDSDPFLSSGQAIM